MVSLAVPLTLILLLLNNNASAGPGQGFRYRSKLTQLSRPPDAQDISSVSGSRYMRLPDRKNLPLPALPPREQPGSVDGAVGGDESDPYYSSVRFPQAQIPQPNSPSLNRIVPSANTLSSFDPRPSSLLIRPSNINIMSAPSRERSLSPARVPIAIEEQSNNGFTMRNANNLRNPSRSSNESPYLTRNANSQAAMGPSNDSPYLARNHNSQAAMGSSNESPYVARNPGPLRRSRSGRSSQSMEQPENSFSPFLDSVVFGNDMSARAPSPVQSNSPSMRRRSSRGQRSRSGSSSSSGSFSHPASEASSPYISRNSDQGSSGSSGPQASSYMAQPAAASLNLNQNRAPELQFDSSPMTQEEINNELLDMRDLARLLKKQKIYDPPPGFGKDAWKPEQRGVKPNPYLKYYSHFLRSGH